MIEILHRLDLLGQATHFGVVFLRIVGLFVFLPIFGSSLLPLKMRMMIAAVLSLGLMPLLPSVTVAPADAVGWTLLGMHELSIGLGLGLVAKMIFSGIEGAAGLVAGQSGFALASMVDPTSGDQALAPALFQNLLTISLFLAADLHHLFVGALMQSYELLAPKVALPLLGNFDQFASMLGLRLFGVAVELAAPALIVTVAVDLVMALVGKAMPQVPIMLVGYPLKMAVGLVAMAILATATGASLNWIGRMFSHDAELLLAALGS